MMRGATERRNASGSEVYVQAVVVKKERERPRQVASHARRGTGMQSYALE